MLCRFVTNPIEIDLARKKNWTAHYLLHSMRSHVVEFAFPAGRKMILLQTHFAFRIVFTIVPGVIGVPAVGAKTFLFMFWLPIVKNEHLSPAQ